MTDKQHNFLISDSIKSLMLDFVDAGHEIRIVGGAVRDWIMGKEPKDIDLCTTATPYQMLEDFSDDFTILQTGLQHGTLTFMVDGEPIEITTLRVDHETDGRYAVVGYTKSFRTDANRRDFTQNAMSLDVNGVLYDYFNGQEDIANNQIKFVGNPEERVMEDYLRILRYFRFAARLPYSATRASVPACFYDPEVVSGLSRISGERCWSEMKQILAAPVNDAIIDSMIEIGAFKAMGIPVTYERTSGGIPAGNPMMKLTSLLVNPSPETVKTVIEKWRLSKVEQADLWYYTNNAIMLTTRDAIIDELFFCQKHITKEMILNKIRMQNPTNTILYDQFVDWDVPVFPVTGAMLLEQGHKPGVHIGEMLNTMKREWVSNNFKGC